jgi:hypothetical protein
LNVNGTLIITPSEDPVAYGLDWRAAVAAACPEGLPAGTPAAIHRDQHLKRYLAHLRYRARHPLSGEPAVFDRISAWRASATGRILEAYLLTVASYADIGARLGLLETDVQTYERLFYSVRDEAGKPVAAVLARLRSELQDVAPDRLKQAALTAGLAGLTSILAANSDTDDLGALVDFELRRRLVAGVLQTRDLVQLQRNATIRAQVEAASQSPTEPVQVMARTMQAMLDFTAPKMVEIVRSEEQTAVLNSEIRGRIASQRTSTGIGVSAVREGALDDLIRRKLVGNG